jgi:hypothetical protein
MSGRLILILGDIITLAIVTIIGFASHGTAGSAGARMLTTFLPLLASWFLVAPFLGVYDLERVKDIKQIWRPFWAMVLAGPFASWMRGAWLNAPILPLFVVILGGTGALAILAWRIVYYFISSRKQ